MKRGVRSPLVQEDEVIVHVAVCERKGLQHHTFSLADNAKLCGTARSASHPIDRSSPPRETWTPA